MELLSKKTVWWECMAGTTVCTPMAEMARERCPCTALLLCHVSQCRCTWSFAECVWLLLKPQVFACHQARCRVALALEEMLGYFTVIFLFVVFFRKWKF